MERPSIKKRIIDKFGEGFYHHIFKEQVDLKCSCIMISRFYHEKYNRFYFKMKSKETNRELDKFRGKTYFESLWSRVYKEYGEQILLDYNDSDEYLEMLNEKREMLYSSLNQ